MTAFKLLDAYSLRARLFPAPLASASLIAALAILVPWHRLSLLHALASAAVPILLFAMADIARRIGKAREPKLYEKWGGVPTTRMMRHADTTLDAATKAAYITFVGGKINAAPPTPQAEAANPKAADAFYGRCAAWLRENTRDAKSFTILFSENVTYGFRRNLFALRTPALLIDVLLFAGAAIAFLYLRPDTESDLSLKLILLLGASFLHGLYMALAATEWAVRDAAEAYARQLLLCCEALNTTAAVKPKRDK